MRTILILTLVPFVLVVIMAGVLITNPEIEFSIGQSFLKGDVLGQNNDWGIFWVKRAADGGQPEAQAMLGRNYLVGLPHQDLEQAVKYLTMGEQKNNNECIKLLAYAYSYGQGVPQNYTRAIELSNRSLKLERDGRELMNLSFLNLILPDSSGNYKKAREYSAELMKLGYTSAWSYWCLGIIYEYGLGTDKDPKLSAQFYEQGAILGDNDCQYALARIAREGKNVKTAPPILRQYLENSSKTQVLDAQILLALTLATELRDTTKENTYKDLLTKLELRGFRSYVQRLRTVSPPGKVNDSFQAIKVLLDESNDTDGSKHLVASLMKRFGFGTKADFSAFLASLDWACEKQLPDAATIKANILTGMDFSAPDYKKATALYQHAAEKEQFYAQGQLGMLYALGLGCEHDWEKAISWLAKSADAGDPESQYMLAGFYCDGRGVKPDRRKSVELFERAARQGHEDAMLEIGIMCGSGDFPDLKQDLQKAENYFRQAAGYGFQESNYYLGTMLGGRGRSHAAFECFQEAANKGHLLSEIQVGRYYMNQDNFVEGRKWFDKAIKQGSLTASRDLQLLAIREAILGNNRKSQSLVVAAVRIEKGTVIKKEMIRTAENKLEEVDSDWQNDILTAEGPAVGATAEQDIDAGEYVTASEIDFPARKNN